MASAFIPILCSTLLLTSLTVFSAEQAAAPSVIPQAVTLQEAFLSAVRKTEPVPIQEQLAAQADEQYRQGWAQLLPNLNLTGNYTHTELPSSLKTGVVGTFYPTSQSSVKFTLTQPIFHGFGEYAGLRERNEAYEAARAQVEAAKLTLYGTVATAYYNVVANERDLVTLRQMRDLTGQRVTELKEFVRVGRSRIGDQLLAQTQQATLEAQIELDLSQLKQARESFSFVTGLPDSTQLIDPEAGSEQRLPESLPSLERMLSALNQRADLEAARRAMVGADEQVTVAKAGHLPSVDASADYYLMRTGPLEGSNWDAQVTLTIPIFAGGGTQSQVREAVDRRKQLELTYEQAKRQAATDVRNYYQSLNSALVQVKAYEKAVALARAGYLEETREYRDGLVTNLDVLTTLDTYRQNQRQLDKTRYGALSTYASLQAAVGHIPALVGQSPRF